MKREAAIQRSMERIAIGRTTIIIAHRLSTIRNADMIYVPERGRLREQGHHEELVAADGVYADLWRIQTGEDFFDFGMSGRNPASEIRNGDNHGVRRLPTHLFERREPNCCG